MADDNDDNMDMKEENKSTEPIVRDDISVTLMGSVLEKLRIMEYEKEMGKKKNFTPYTETQFAYQTNNASAQFKSFLELVCFLMKQANQEFVVDKYDDPNTSVNKLILSLKVMGFPLDFPSSKLKLGYGEAVCAVLDFICDKALSTRHFNWSKPEYPKEEFADEAQVDEEAEVEANDENPHVLDKDVPDEDEELFMITHKEKDLEESFQQMIISQVDPLKWKTELERVGPKLKISSNHMDDKNKEWHLHVEKIIQHEKIMYDYLPKTNIQLKEITNQLQETNQKMISKEKIINNQYEHLRQEFSQIKQKLHILQDKNKEKNDQVNVMTNEFTELMDQLKETKSNMDEKGSKMTDTSPLVQIKEALKNLTIEIKNFELRIGVVSHTLLQAKSKYAGSRHRKSSVDGGTSLSVNDPEYDHSDGEDSN